MLPIHFICFIVLDSRESSAAPTPARQISQEQESKSASVDERESVDEAVSKDAEEAEADEDIADDWEKVCL